jgi:hypothetical protein
MCGVVSAHFDMVRGRMMFRDIITQIQGAWCPIDVELFLVYTILDPIKVHVHCLGTFEFDSFVDYPCGCGIISLKWRGRLWMIEFKECLADWHGLLAVDEKGTGFRFGGGGHGMLDDFNFLQNGSVMDVGFTSSISKVKVAPIS